ncbi:MAG: hypothetical protein H3C43_00745 [Leptonema sp. (in: Bacteria)]|nr:hypothetical protein [Leptonema sp. (in: bacteria)]
MQLIEAKKDGTVKMSLRISVTKAFQDGKQSTKPPIPSDLISDSNRIHKNIQIQDLSDDLTLRRQFNFTSTRKLLSAVSDKDEGAFLPYPDGDNQWVFLFRPSKKGLADNQDSMSELDEKGSEQFAAMFLASAQYRIFFRGSGLPRQVVFTSINGTQHHLKATPFGDGMLVDCPIMLVFKGGVLTTSTLAKIDFTRTTRLIDYLKEQKNAKLIEEPKKDENIKNEENLKQEENFKSEENDDSYNFESDNVMNYNVL